MMVVLIGMVGLAIEGGRAYVDRRELQDAVDAAALAAGDNYQNFHDVNRATQAAVNAYARNERITSVQYTQPYFPNNTEHTFSFGYNLTDFNGYFFTATATHSLPVAMMQVLGVGPTFNVGASATSVINNQRQTPALLTLRQTGCSLTLEGDTALTVRGDVYSNGCITLQGNSALGIAGNGYAHTGVIPGGITFLCYDPNPNVPPHSAPCASGETIGQPIPNAPALPDPNYCPFHRARPGDPCVPFYYTVDNPPTISHPGWTEMQPGIYHNWALTGGTGCYFMDPGTYTWNGDYTSHGGFSSNALDYSQRANPQFWDAKSCAGTFTVAVANSVTPGVPKAPAVSSPNTPQGNYPATYGVELTSVRLDWFPPPGNTGATQYTRESSPSMCRSVQVTGPNQGIQVQVTAWTPGAQYYNVYVNPRGCSPQGGTLGFGFAKQVQANTTVNFTLDGNDLPGAAWVLGNQCNPQAVPPKGCNPPDGETQAQCFITCGSGNNGLAQEPAPRAILPSGDRANENYCLPQSTPQHPCDGAQVTPGAVLFYFANNGDCLDENGNGFTYVFSGYQYDWLSIFQDHNDANCGNVLNGGAYTSYIGTVYTPAAGWTINGGDRAPLSGQVIAATAIVNGDSTIGVNFNPDYGPAPPAARLVQ